MSAPLSPSGRPGTAASSSSPATATATPALDSSASDDAPDAATREARLWIDNGWTARVIKNEDDEGWAVAMFKGREPEPALVGPWTMGRDKKNPKPLDVAAFNTLVKTASEVLRRHEQQLHAQLHRQVRVETPTMRWEVTLDIVPDEDEPHALLAALSAEGEQVAPVRVPAHFKLTAAAARAWIDAGFGRPAA